MCSGWVFFLISLGSPRVRAMGVHRTCGGSNGIELTAIGVELNGPRRVRGPPHRVVAPQVLLQVPFKSRSTTQVRGQFDRNPVPLVHLHVRCTPHVACR